MWCTTRVPSNLKSVQMGSHVCCWFGLLGSWHSPSAAMTIHGKVRQKVQITPSTQSLVANHPLNPLHAQITPSTHLRWQITPFINIGTILPLSFNSSLISPSSVDVVEYHRPRSHLQAGSPRGLCLLAICLSITLFTLSRTQIQRSISIASAGESNSATVKLPPEKRFRRPEIYWMSSKKSEFMRVITSTIPTDPLCKVLAIHLGKHGHSFSFCRTGDHAWIRINNFVGWCSDAIFYKGDFYAIDFYDYIWVIQPTVNNFQKAVKLSVEPVKEGCQCYYLVEVKGDLLMGVKGDLDGGEETMFT
ncbi:hypothetical protein SLEP1_g17913 [Rubroshorea leprosula]|uniref:KIB1-4 beta-propeller domain-containing protein n=1 Tax=Rubroshorea leprosula TaxID=152421 RepID=A0AAV5J4R9_9ROSI|nr:hypothetical protein SLEP1_g17913 [Rubroshorea leprosula]